MNFPSFEKVKVKQRLAQEVRLEGINLTDNYSSGQMESCKGITSDRYPYIATDEQPEEVEQGIADGYQAVAIFGWEKLFVVSNEPGENGYKCFYNGQYCGDVKNLDLPKQFAVVNTKLIVFPDQVYFNLYAKEQQSYEMTTAENIATVRTGKVIFRKAVTA